MTHTTPFYFLYKLVGGENKSQPWDTFGFGFWRRQKIIGQIDHAARHVHFVSHICLKH